MELKLLRAFLTVAECEHFGRAAERLCLTQPALTKQIQALERDLGAALFERGRHGAALTPFGEQMRADARRLVAEAEAMRTRARQAARGERGRLAIGFGLSAIDVAPRCIAAFRQRHPGVAVTMNDFSTREQTRRLLDGALDLGFLRLPVEPPLRAMPLLEERLALVVAANAPWAALPVAPEALNELGFIALAPPRGPGLADQIRRWCAARGFVPGVTQEADDIQTVVALVAAGTGAALLPARAGRLLADSVRVLPLDGEASEWTVGLAWNPERDNPAVDRFVAVARETAV
jgi:DNA-binding transcriptional LysR family regulator